MKQWTGIQNTRSNVLPILQDYVEDPTGNKLIQRMDQSSFDATIVNVVDKAPLLTEAEILNRHQMCAKLVAHHPKRLIALTGIDPRRKQAPKLL
jgi:hypothetical protein